MFWTETIAGLFWLVALVAVLVIALARIKY